MKDFLVSIDNDLPSSIALRLACRLAGLLEAKVQIIHVKEPGADAPAIGAGWAMHSWHQELLAQAGEEIIQLLHEDLSRCTPLEDPILAVGDRDAEVSAELRRNHYDLLALGLSAPPQAASLHRLLHLDIPHQMACPMLVGLTMNQQNNVLFCLDDGKDGAQRRQRFAALVKDADLAVDLAAIRFTGEEKPERDETSPGGDLETAAAHFKELGLTIGEQKVWRGEPEDLAALSEGYGLIAPPLDRATAKDSPWVATVKHCTTSLLLC